MSENYNELGYDSKNGSDNESAFDSMYATKIFIKQYISTKDIRKYYVLIFVVMTVNF